MTLRKARETEPDWSEHLRVIAESRAPGNDWHLIFVDTNVSMYAVGRSHHLRAAARQFFIRATRDLTPLCTSAEVLQELAHAYLPVGEVVGL